MSSATRILPESSCFNMRTGIETNNTRRHRQELIRDSWSASEKNRRRELAAVQQLRLFEILQGNLQRTAC